MKSFPFLIFTICLSLPIPSLWSQTIYSAVKNFQSKEFLQDASIAIRIVDLSSNTVLSEVNPNKVMPTASTTKLFATAYALEELGPDYSAKTIIGTNGKINGSNLSGDLIIQSFGDVSLGSKYFAGNKDSFIGEWLNAIQEKGIQQITGRVIVDGSVFGYEGSPADWQWGDIGNAYGAHFSGTNLYDNILLYTFKTGRAGTVSELLYTTPRLALNFDNRIYAAKVSGDNSSIFGAVHSLQRYGTGEIPELKNSFTIRGSLPDPEQALADLVLDALKKNGVTVKNGVSSRNIPDQVSISDTLFIYSGKPLSEVLKATNYESVNLFAEGVLRWTAAEKVSKFNHNGACDEMQKYWRNKLNTKSLIFNDGSGLSRTNCISATHLTDLLAYMNKSNQAEIYYQSLPQAGLHGTLKSVSKNKPAQGVMRAKSGTMRRIKSYAGYVESKSGKRLAFAIISNYHSCSNKELVNAMEEIFDAMANY